MLSMEVTTAARAHNCRQSNQHRIAKGMKRLTIKVDGDSHHYCLTCASSFLAKDLHRMQSLLAEVKQYATSASATLQIEAPHANR